MTEAVVSICSSKLVFLKIRNNKFAGLLRTPLVTASKMMSFKKNGNKKAKTKQTTK